MHVFRIQKSKYGNDISGAGSNLAEGRWHLKGVNLRILYTSENQSLALLEKIESFTKQPGLSLPTFIMLEIFVPDNSIRRIETETLPDGWDSQIRNTTSQAIGIEWLQGNHSLGLSVPSVYSADRNILINPQHPDFIHVRVVKTTNNFKIDSRLIKGAE